MNEVFRQSDYGVGDSFFCFRAIALLSLGNGHTALRFLRKSVPKEPRYKIVTRIVVVQSANQRCICVFKLKYAPCTQTSVNQETSIRGVNHDDLAPRA